MIISCRQDDIFMMFFLHNSVHQRDKTFRRKLENSSIKLNFIIIVLWTITRERTKWKKRVATSRDDILILGKGNYLFPFNTSMSEELFFSVLFVKCKTWICWMYIFSLFLFSTVQLNGFFVLRTMRFFVVIEN